jgi:hypothetical protein
MPISGLSAIKQNRPFGSIFGSDLQFSPLGSVGRHETHEAMALCSGRAGALAGCGRRPSLADHA